MAEILYKAEALERAIDQCMAYCLENHKAPVDFNLHQFTDISHDTVSNYIKWAEEMEAGKRERNEEIIKSAKVLKNGRSLRLIFGWILG